MRIGTLRHLATVCQPIDTQTAKGDIQIVYDPENGSYSFQAYCSIEPLTGRELLYAKQIRADIAYKIRFRFNRLITHRCQVQWNDGTVTRKFNLGPPVQVDTMQNWEMSFYAVEIV